MLDELVQAEEHMDVESVSEMATMSEVVDDGGDQRCWYKMMGYSAMVSSPKSMES